MVIGLTGGFGCGKSTVRRISEKSGAQTEDADQVVHTLLRSDSVVREALRGRYGDEILDARGEVDRRRVGKIVFARANELEWLEKLLHPRVHKAWEDRVGRRPSDVWVVEIPLLFEKNLEKSFEFTVCVSASRVVQYARLMLAGHSEAQIKGRSSRQLPLSEKILRADFVISNNGTIEFVREQTEQLFDQLGIFSV